MLSSELIDALYNSCYNVLVISILQILRIGHNIATALNRLFNHAFHISPCFHVGANLQITSMFIRMAMEKTHLVCNII